MLSLGDFEMSSYGVKKFVLPCKFMYESIQKSLSEKLMIQTMTS